MKKLKFTNLLLIQILVSFSSVITLNKIKCTVLVIVVEYHGIYCLNFQVGTSNRIPVVRDKQHFVQWQTLYHSDCQQISRKLIEWTVDRDVEYSSIHVRGVQTTEYSNTESGYVFTRIFDVPGRRHLDMYCIMHCQWLSLYPYKVITYSNVKIYMNNYIYKV